MPDPVLSEPEAAQLLAISPRTLRRKRLASEIAYVQLSDRRIGYLRSQLDAYLEHHSVTPEKMAGSVAPPRTEGHVDAA